MKDNMDNYLTHFKAVAFEQLTDALRASTRDDLCDVLTEVQTLMKLIKPMGRNNIDVNMLYNDLMVVHSFVAEKLIECDD